MTIRPPRALWVSFPLGRPLGNPNDPAFQRKVISHALDLLRRPSGPVLEDFARDCSEQQAAPAVPACPVDFSTRPEKISDMEQLLANFDAEFNSLYTWYSMARGQNGRTAVGVSALTFDQLISLYRDFLMDRGDSLLLSADGLADRLRLGAEDLKSCYFEALSAQPNQPTDAASLADWFWGETLAAAVINEVRKKCLQQGTKEMELAGKLLLVPRSQMHRFQ
jgi:D-proline reductase (dithiol) PrdB